ncbi:hypothetical protein CEP51_016898, partial [Fusarium floridanum]
MSSAPDTSLPLASHLLLTPPSSSGTSTISDSGTSKIKNEEMALAARFICAVEKI